MHPMISYVVMDKRCDRSLEEQLVGIAWDNYPKK